MEHARDAQGEVATNETHSLIASDKIEGTSVYNRQGESLGSVYNVMIDKQSGQVAYAVLQFGGFLGIGSDYFPLPWKKLHYDTRMGGYVVDIDKDRLEQAPRYSAERSPDWADPAYGRSIDRHYGYV
jgi:sporulation protein YlmC with PRC-barrel domain